VPSAVCSDLQVEAFFPLEKDINEEEGLRVIILQVACSSLWFRVDFLCQSIHVLFLSVRQGAEMHSSSAQLAPGS